MLGPVQKKVFAVLDKYGWQMTLEAICKLAGLEWPRQKMQVFTNRKIWLRRNRKQREYRAAARQQGLPRPQFASNNKSGGNARGKGKQQNVVYAILDRKGVQTSLPSIVAEAHKNGVLISIAYAGRLRKQYCDERKIVSPDCRTLVGQPERNMDRESSPRAAAFIKKLQRKYKISDAEIRELGRKFDSVKIRYAA